MENANKTLRFHRIHSSGGLGMYVSYPLSYWDGFPDVPDATDAPSMINVPSLNNQIALDLIDGIKEHVDGGSTAFPQNGADVMIKNIKGSDGRNLPLIPVAWLYIFRVFPIQDGQKYVIYRQGNSVDSPAVNGEFTVSLSMFRLTCNHGLNSTLYLALHT